MKKLFMAVIALMMTISVSAQFYIYCSDGNIITVDSISMVAPSELEDSTVTKDPYNGHEYVDLGLSVKWATCNVGATKSEDYGSYYAWGEISPKSSYNWGNYKYGNGSHFTLIKYNNDSTYGPVDNKSILEAADDAAQTNWGGSWRIPTKEEAKELRSLCTWKWTTQNGVEGYKVTSKCNGNSIFLPAAGVRNGSSLYNAGNTAYYWSNSLYFSGSCYANTFEYGDRSTVIAEERSCGCSIRPVCP